MRALTVVAAVLGLLGGLPTWTWAQPTINSNFVTNVTVTAEMDTALQLFDQSPMIFARSGAETAKIYQWHSGNVTRLDFTHPDSSLEQVFQFWPGATLPSCPTVPPAFTTGIQYNYSPATDTCTQTALPLPYPTTGFFDFVQNATQAGTCSDNGRSGTQWVIPRVDNGQVADFGLCANGNTPLLAYWTPFSATVHFNTFTPGVPAASNFCLPAACAATVETHDTVVLPVAPLHLTIPVDATAVTKTLRVRVVNADVSPSPELPGHTIQLVAGGDCPAGTIVGLPDFGNAAAGPSDTVVIAGGVTKTAKVALNIDTTAFTTFNPKAPRRCTLLFTAKTVTPTTWYEPTPANNSVSVELNVIDENDPGQTTTHESYVQSVTPLKVKLGDGTTTKNKKARASAGNADILPTPEDPGDVIVITASDGDCPTGTVGAAAPGSVTVKGGKTKSGSTTLTIDASAFTTTNAKSPSRCTALLTATGPTRFDPDGSNNSTKLVIDVTDQNDF